MLKSIRNPFRLGKGRVIKDTELVDIRNLFRQEIDK